MANSEELEPKTPKDKLEPDSEPVSGVESTAIPETPDGDVPEDAKTEKAVDDIRAVDAKRTGGKTLQVTSKLVSELDAHLVLVREALAAGRLFFTDANLALLAYIAADAEKRKKLTGLTVSKLATSPSSR